MVMFIYITSFFFVFFPPEMHCNVHGQVYGYMELGVSRLWPASTERIKQDVLVQSSMG